MANPHRNAKIVKLSDFIIKEKFRTIMSNCRHVRGGVSEIPVEIQMKMPFAEKLSFYVPWDCVMYGFVRDKKNIFKDGSFNCTKISLSDWGDGRFQLMFESSKETDELVYFVESDDVRKLLEGCMRPQEQRIPKDEYKMPKKK